MQIGTVEPGGRASVRRWRGGLGFGVLGVLLPSLLAACNEARPAPPPPPPTVYVAVATRRDVPLFIEAVGALDGYVNADIRARVRGYLQRQDYKDGATVKAGQTLFTIDPAEYTTAVDAAKANLARAKAAQARSNSLLERDQSLVKNGTVSQQELDNAVAGVGDADGQVHAAQAQLEQANLNLSYTVLRSPIPGVAGVALVRVGNLVGQDGPTLLTTVSQIDPMRVNFPMSEVDYVRSPDRLKHLDARDLGWAKKQFERLAAGQPAEGGDPGLELVLSDGRTFSHRGVIVSANRQVDPSTGTITLQALVPNPDGELRPGQYSRVRLPRQSEGHDVLAVPEKALIAVQGSYSVAVVGPDNKVQLRRVELGPSAQGLRVVEKGIVAGDRIVVEGTQKVADGAMVDPRPAPDAAARK
ncbi:MAG: efflux RND transporter periplasmic adaptor subunit [Myxococcales bacterium]|nr:efflux RND transporter periplasmic adaptor subunit [Myxococcales bacterium]